MEDNIVMNSADTAEEVKVDRDAHLVPQIGKFQERPRAELVVKLVLFTAAITAMAVMSAFYPIWANIPFIVIPSLLTLFFAKPVFSKNSNLRHLLLCVYLSCLQ